MKQGLNIFICHFNSKYRQYLHTTLGNHKDTIEIIGACEEYPCCLEWLEKDVSKLTDCVLIGLPNRVNNPKQIVKELTSQYPYVKFITMSPFEIEHLAELYINAGANHHFDSSKTTQDLINYILDYNDKGKEANSIRR